MPKDSPGLEVEFPVKNGRFGCVCVELCHFSSFLPGLESCEPLFDDLGPLFHDASHGVHPLQPISGPCSIEKYPSSRMANRYTRIFDAGGQKQFKVVIRLAGSTAAARSLC